MAKPEQSTPRDQRVMVRLTEDELLYVQSRGDARKRRTSGLVKADGSLNLSAVIRDIVLDGMARK